MNLSNPPMEIALRIPGTWSDPSELIERLPAGFELTAETLVLPDGSQIEVALLPADEQFPMVFGYACRQPATAEEMKAVRNYRLNVGLIGPGGSLPAALAMMQAAAAIVRAGGAGVFIDNSALAHGGSQWLEMSDDGGPDAVSFAYVGIVRSDQEVFTLGMHILGRPDLVMRASDLDPAGETIIEVLRYLCDSENPVLDGHVLADEEGPRFQAEAIDDSKFAVASPMHNPFGRLNLVSVKDVAERN
ncbi:MAG: hypothetical protein GTO03_18355 [Planctomycetales bacterium]|nr:hypothetical protein [Planctomycetales bacterium]